MPRAAVLSHPTPTPHRVFYAGRDATIFNGVGTAHQPKHKQICYFSEPRRAKETLGNSIAYTGMTNLLKVVRRVVARTAIAFQIFGAVQREITASRIAVRWQIIAVDSVSCHSLSL
jgi:hypothetical protein